MLCFIGNIVVCVFSVQVGRHSSGSLSLRKDDIVMYNADRTQPLDAAPTSQCEEEPCRQCIMRPTNSAGMATQLTYGVLVLIAAAMAIVQH